MLKRKASTTDLQVVAPHGGSDAMTQPSGSGAVALGFIPGQFDTIYVSDASPESDLSTLTPTSVATAALRLAANTTHLGFKAFFKTTWRAYQRYTQQPSAPQPEPDQELDAASDPKPEPQPELEHEPETETEAKQEPESEPISPNHHIVAHKVTRDDGALKKVLVEAGIQDDAKPEAATLTPPIRRRRATPQQIAARRIYCPEQFPRRHLTLESLKIIAHLSDDEDYKGFLAKHYEQQIASQQQTTSQEQVTTEEQDLSGYGNDLSYLPDAGSPPPRRNVQFAMTGHHKRFFKDEAPNELLDSSIFEIDLEDDLSLEVSEEFQDLSFKEPEIYDSDYNFFPVLETDEYKYLQDVRRFTDDGHKEMEFIDGKLTTRDLGTLLPMWFNGNPSAWLNDNIVNEYLSLLVGKMLENRGFKHQSNGAAPPVHAFSSQWFETMKSRPDTIQRWASRRNLSGEKFLDCELIFLPLCSSKHWRLVAIRPQDRVIEYYDSLGWSGDEIKKSAQLLVIKVLGPHYIPDEWTFEVRDCAHQLNGSDCGVFACMNARALLLLEDVTLIRPSEGMEDERQRMAISLLTREAKELKEFEVGLD